MTARWAVIALLGFAAPSVSKEAASIDPGGGWHEAVVVTSDLDSRLRFFRDVIGWRVMGVGRSDPAQLAAWNLPASARGREAVLAAPGSQGGWIRFVELAGVGPQRRIRSAAQPWEAGGWGGLNVRVRDIGAVHALLQRHGWQSFSDPVQLVVPPYTVSEVMVTGPDGLTLSLIERIDPPLDSSAWRGLWSPAVTAFEASRDMAASRAFWVDTLGFKRRLAFAGPASPPGMNLFGLPHDLVASITRSVDWVQPRGDEPGTVAILHFTGVRGRDFGGDAGPPALGLVLLRFPVPDAATQCAGLGLRLWRFRAEPLGKLTGCTARAPSGAWLELFSRVDE